MAVPPACLIRKADVVWMGKRGTSKVGWRLYEGKWAVNADLQACAKILKKSGNCLFTNLIFLV